jgi:small-conductance mechanosensitive channel
MTRDDIQIIVPNAIMANSKIINESGGPSLKHRIRCRLSVAYGSDVDQVRALLMSLAEHCTELAVDPAPRVRFRALGDSGLDFELMGWIEDSSFRGRVLDSLYTDIYKQFSAAGIEIPYPKHDVYLHQAVPEGDEPAPKATGPALMKGVE